ncbi:MAG TPA: hypothetical protein VFQ61_30315 [Polyangiaceae bacterium]|nr:hypothetical protein [Polyangiaceae bacterium]
MSEPLLDDDPASTLSALEALHEEELSVLRNMDRASLDDLTARKEQLCEQLRAAQLSGKLTDRHRSQIERIRQKAAHNQLLVVHARDAVRGILSQATGVCLDVLPSGRRGSTQEGLRLNVRG